MQVFLNYLPRKIKYFQAQKEARLVEVEGRGDTCKGEGVNPCSIDFY